MFVRHWCFVVAVGLGANAALADPPRPPSHGTQDAANHQETPADIEGEGFPWTWITAANTYFGIEGCLPNPVNDLGAANQKEQTRQHDACDLKAQEIAANSSRWLLMITLGQTVLAIFGTWLVWRSLRLTRAATKAALDAVAVTREMGERQIRAYLGVLEIVGKNFVAGQAPEFSLKINNTGQSPARKCQARVTLQPTEGRADNFRIRLPLTKDLISKSDISANAGVSVNLGLGGKVENGDLDQIRSGKVSFILAGLLIYHDVFGKTKRLVFKYNSEPLKEGATTVTFRACNKGNHSS